MKKFLIASTALVMTAGVAAAEVKFGGDARFGIQYNGAGFNNKAEVAAVPTIYEHTAQSAAAAGGGAAAGQVVVDATGAAAPANTTLIQKGAAAQAAVAGRKTILEKRMSLNIDGSTTTDNGVTFGARIRIRSDENNGTAVNGARVFARAGGLTVAAGNILGAVESMPNLYGPSVGLTGLGWSGLVANSSLNAFAWDAYDSRGNGAEGVEVIYTMGDFTGHVSYSSDSLRGVAGGNAKRLGAYGSYNISGWTVALGMQDSSLAAEDKIILTASGKIGDFGIGFGAARNGSGAKKVNKFALNGSYTIGATTLSGYVASESGHVGVAVPASKTTYGIGASYNMGGGARIVGGIERTTAKVTRADIGVAFSF